MAAFNTLTCARYQLDIGSGIKLIVIQFKYFPTHSLLFIQIIWFGENSFPFCVKIFLIGSIALHSKKSYKLKMTIELSEM